MTQKQPEITVELEDQAIVIAEEVFELIHEYTHDSALSKFFLTDEIANASYVLAGGFAAVIYNPALDPKEVEDTEILSFLYAMITYGFNLALKERSLLTNSSPYTLPNDKKKIKAVQKHLLEKASKGDLEATGLGNKIIAIIVNNIKTKIAIRDFRIKDHRIQTKKFHEYAKLSLYWGYNFAHLLLKSN
ncbi:MAG: hypothetical protein AAB553_02140 [Patescibacteria group bacterium]